jgi:hypothetical protein
MEITSEITETMELKFSVTGFLSFKRWKLSHAWSPALRTRTYNPPECTQVRMVENGGRSAQETERPQRA